MRSLRRARPLEPGCDRDRVGDKDHEAGSERRRPEGRQRAEPLERGRRPGNPHDRQEDGTGTEEHPELKPQFAPPAPGDLGTEECQADEDRRPRAPRCR